MLDMKGIRLQRLVVLLCTNAEDFSDLLYEMPTIVAAADVWLKCTVVFSPRFFCKQESANPVFFTDLTFACKSCCY